jgi:peptidoglycan hydrolase CwlO-like protein
MYMCIICRGKQMVGLVEAAKQVKSCQDAVEQAEKALAEAKANLVVVLGQAQDYITTEQAEDEAQDREREAEHEAQQRAAAALVGNGSAVQPRSAHSAPQAQAGNTVLALKPFKISLDPS